jgi:hypothetical protein
MGEMIQKPDANPVIVAVANFFILGALGWIPVLVFTYDGYLLGQKLQSGQSIGENENGLDFLNSIFKD